MTRCKRRKKRFSLFRAAGVAVLGLCLAAPLTAAAAAPELGKTFAAPGATIYYEVRGDGPGTPLFLANGGPGFDHGYLHVSDVWDQLAKDRPVIFWDQRGTGRSPVLKPLQSCTLADQISDLEALRDHLGYEKIDLLGHSWGGYLAMAYAARHPGRIAHLLIVDSAAPRWQDTLFLFDKMYPQTTERQEGLAFAMALGDADAIAAYLREYMSMLCLSPEKRDALVAASASFVYRQSVNEAIHADLARFDLNPELRKLRVPTLVITGRYDFNVAPATAYAIHKAIPASRFVVFERSGHLPFYEEPEEFRRVVAEFLSGQ